MSKKRKIKLRWVFAALLVAVSVWLGFDLYGPRSSSLRSFDANEVARLETAMWRSYYDRKRVRLFAELAELMRTQYKFPFVRSNLVAYQAAKAAFTFKEGKSRLDYEKALPDLVKFYSEIRRISESPFDVERAARVELEWWIVHRERASHPQSDLERVLAELPAEIYQIPIDRFDEHARLRAEAMAIRDSKAEAGGVSEADWTRIDELLHASWQSLWKAVNI